jgi:hypothetical protein
MASGPSIAKVRRPRALRRRDLTLFTLSDDALREIMSTADVVSEGKTSTTGAELRYDGTTSIQISFSQFETDPRVTRATIIEVIAACPHLRLRATRIAHREAASRAHGMLSTLSSATSVSVSNERIAIVIEVSGRVDAQRRASSSR